MSTDIKQCPFCGGKGIVNYRIIGIFSKDAAYIRCGSCGASTRAVEVSASYSAREKAIEIWNMRAYDETEKQ